MAHIREPDFGHRYGKRFNLACPQGRDPIMDCRQREASNPVEQAAHRQHRITMPCRDSDISASPAQEDTVFSRLLLLI
jgi:hypothetical protein